MTTDPRYVPCPTFANLVEVWLLMPGRDVMTEVWRHRVSCERCAENEQALKVAKEQEE